MSSTCASCLTSMGLPRARSRRRSRIAGVQPSTLRKFVAATRRMQQSLNNGTVVGFPLAVLLGSEHARPDDLRALDVAAGGYGLHVPSRDADISLPSEHHEGMALAPIQKLHVDHVDNDRAKCSASAAPSERSAYFAWQIVLPDRRHARCALMKSTKARSGAEGNDDRDGQKRPREALPPRLQHSLQGTTVEIWTQPFLEQLDDAAARRLLHRQQGRLPHRHGR